MTRSSKPLLLVAGVCLLAGCSRSAGNGPAPLHHYSASDDSLVLVCGDSSFRGKLDVHGGTAFAEAKVFPGGTWELTASDDSPPDAVRYYEQARGESCQVMAAKDWKKLSGN